MPFPDSYTRGFGFEGFQDSHPATPLPGTQVDVELDNAAKSTASLVTFLKKFTRADGKLANGSVGIDQLAADFDIGFKAPTPWEPGIDYLENDTVFQGTGFYNCNTAHTSAGSFDPSKWSLIVDFGSTAQAAAASAAAAAASAALAATVDGMFSAPVLSITGTPAGSPSIGDRYLVAASGTSGVFVGKENQVAVWSGLWVFSGAPKSGQILWNTGAGFAYKFDGTSWIKRRSKLAFVSDFATLSSALTFAAAATVRLVVDDDRTLAAGTSISASIPALSFEGGKLTLGSFDLTFNGQPVRAEPEQIFNSTSTGKVKGTIGGSICVDWWGTTSASTASSVTTNAGNDCWNYVVQSSNPRARVYLGKANYYLSDSWVKPESFYVPQIEGRGATLNYAFGSSKAALVLIGGSGYPAVQGYVEGLTFAGDTSSNGLELRGQCGVTIRGCVFETNNIGLLLHNSAASSFSEFNVWRDCAFRGAKVWWYYRRTSGTDSFNGSGPDGNVVCNDNSPTQARILADDNTSVYNMPQTFKAFPTTATYPLISIGNGCKYLPSEGTVSVENASGAPATFKLLTAGSGSKAYGVIGTSGWGTELVPGDLILMDTMGLDSGGVIQGRRRGRLVNSAITTTSTVVTIESAGSTNLLLEVLVQFTNYYWQGLVHVTATAVPTTDAEILVEGDSGGSAFATYGKPVFVWDGTALTITSTSSSFPASGANTQAILLGVTDLGRTF